MICWKKNNFLFCNILIICCLCDYLQLIRKIFFATKKERVHPSLLCIRKRMGSMAEWSKAARC